MDTFCQPEFELAIERKKDEIRAKIDKALKAIDTSKVLFLQGKLQGLHDAHILLLDNIIDTLALQVARKAGYKKL